MLFLRDCRSLSWCIKKGLQTITFSRMSFGTGLIILTYSSDGKKIPCLFFAVILDRLRMITTKTQHAIETTPLKRSVVPLTEVFCFSESPPHLKIHSYRAAVQYVLTETWPGFRHPATRLVVKKGAEVPFPQYVSLVSVCLPCLGLSPLS